MSVRHNTVKTPSVALLNRAPRPPTTWPSTTGTHMFNHSAPDLSKAKVHGVPEHRTMEHYQLVEEFKNVDLWDTLTSEIVTKLMNPPG